MNAADETTVVRMIRAASSDSLAVAVLRPVLVARGNQGYTAALGDLLDRAEELEHQASRTDDEAARAQLLCRARGIREAVAKTKEGR